MLTPAQAACRWAFFPLRLVQQLASQAWSPPIPPVHAWMPVSGRGAALSCSDLLLLQPSDWDCFHQALIQDTSPSLQAQPKLDPIK